MARATDGGPAFPIAGVYGDENIGHQQLERGEEGMALRDYFAAHSPPMDDGWASYRRTDGNDPNEEMRLQVEWAWAYADAMIAARQGGK